MIIKPKYLWDEENKLVKIQIHFLDEKSMLIYYNYSMCCLEYVWTLPGLPSCNASVTWEALLPFHNGEEDIAFLGGKHFEKVVTALSCCLKGTGDMGEAPASFAWIPI